MKKKLLVFFIIIVIISITASISYSNSPPLIMKGDTAFPISHDHIRLESEEIKIHYNSRKVDRWMFGHEVEVVFNFHNQGPETELDIGFPNTANYGEKLRDFEAADYPSMEPYTTEIKDSGTLPGHDTYTYTSMYAWKMHFKEDEKKSLYVRYWFAGTDIQAPADYILVTGALWKGRIDNIDVYVDFPEPAAWPSIFASPGNYYYNGEGIEWHFEDLEPEFNLLVSYVEYPESFELKDEYYLPRQADPYDDYMWDDYFYWIDIFPYEHDMGQLELHQIRDVEKMRTIVRHMKEAGQCIANEIYARNGYIFKEKKWKDLFEEALWYSPDTAFSPDKFNSMEKFNLKYIQEFNKSINMDAPDEDFVKSVEKFVTKYGLEYEPGYGKPYYQYNYTNLKKEKDRIAYIRGLNKQAISLLENDRDFISSKGAPAGINDGDRAKKGPASIIRLSDGGRVELYNDGIYLHDTYGNTRKIMDYFTFSPENNTGGYDAYNTSPQVFDEIKLSPDEKYVIIGTNYQLEEYSGITRNVVYIISIKDGTCYIPGYGDINDYRFWWSPSGKIFCWQDIKSNIDILKIFNTESSSFAKLKVPVDGIDSLEITEEGKVFIQHGEKLHLIDSGQDSITATFDGTLIGVAYKKVYFHKNEKIFYAAFDDLKPVLANTAAHSIWDTGKKNNNTFCLYGGASNLSVYNTGLDSIFHYKNLDYYGLIRPPQSGDYYGALKPSPSGDRIYIYRDYFSFYKGERISEGCVVFSESGEEIFIDVADETAEWIDNENLSVKVYDNYKHAGRQPLMEYKYNILTGSLMLLDKRIDTFKSRVVQEFETGSYGLRYGREKKYSDLKHVLQSNAYIVTERVNVCSDEGLKHKTDFLEKGSLVGILEAGDSSTKVCYFSGADSLWSGWIKNSDYTLDTEVIEPIRAFVYNAGIYEIEGDIKRQILKSCSSQVRILDKKPGWVYINAADKVFGWAAEEDLVFGFDMEKSMSAGDKVKGPEETTESEEKNTEDALKDETDVNSDNPSEEYHQPEKTGGQPIVMPVVIILSVTVFILMYMFSTKSGKT